MHNDHDDDGNGWRQRHDDFWLDDKSWIIQFKKYQRQIIAHYNIGAALIKSKHIEG